MSALQFLPTAAEERARALSRQSRSWASEGAITASEQQQLEAATRTDWRSSGLLLRVVFFLLTAMGVVAFYFFMKLLELPAAAITAMAAIGTAEMLILRKRFLRTGIESALWLGGLFAIISSLPSSGKPEAILVFVAAYALVGLRLRIAFFGALAAGLLVAYAAAKGHGFWPAALASLVFAAGAMLALLRTWRRPSTDELFAWLVVLMPPAGYIVGKLAGGNLQNGRVASEWPIALTYLAIGAVLLVVAIRARHHALFVAAAVTLGIAKFETWGLFDYPHEYQLIASGLLLLGVAFALSRLLRERTSGLVISRTADHFEVARLVATVAIANAQQPPAAEPAQPQVEGGGGRFGGAGATGDY